MRQRPSGRPIRMNAKTAGYGQKSAGGVPLHEGHLAARPIVIEARIDLRDDALLSVHRDAQGHIAFAYGPHLCIGMHLARYETHVAVSSLLDRCRDLRLDPDIPTPEIRGIGFRAPAAINVLFTPEGA